jgi:CBS-domain-containing membrane protein|tara:strand:- start:856 stop:1218 length:363 start_codon:yes stop_codon:yes gene_type:complete
MLKRHRKIEKSKTPIEDIISKTPVDEAKLRRNVWIEGIVLAMPLAVSFAFYVNVILKPTKPATGAMLSPGGNVQSLVFFIFVFIIIYSIFLIFEYGNLKKKLDASKKQPKKVKKARKTKK